jgi:hypothetical protein
VEIQFFARWGGVVCRVCGGDEDDGDGVGNDGDGRGAGWAAATYHVLCCYSAAGAATLLLALLAVSAAPTPPSRTIINAFSVVVICRPYINNVFSVAGFCQYITFSFNSTVHITLGRIS